MSRIASAFARAKAEGRSALVIYLCAGDPDLETTPALVQAAVDAGADIIELGMPFSDPTADGVAIQRASERALAGGASLRGVLAAVRRVREASEVPLMLFGYYNPILAYGETELVADAADAGVDGLLVVDLPPEEAGVLRDAAGKRGVDFVPLVAPTSDDARVAVAAEAATAFVYYVSMTGVTGSALADLGEAAGRAKALEARVGKPVALGFGVKTREDVAQVGKQASGVVVGSAVVRVIEDAGSPEEAVAAVRALVGKLRAGIDDARTV
jgi:tryptophan synthase alpha chain